MIEKLDRKRDLSKVDSFLYSKYVKAFKYIWNNCITDFDEICINDNNNAARFLYIIKNVALEVFIIKDEKIYYEISYKNRRRKYYLPLKDFNTYEDLQYFFVYHLEKLLLACTAATVLKSKEHRMNSIEDIHKYYEAMI